MNTILKQMIMMVYVFMIIVMISMVKQHKPNVLIRKEKVFE